MERKRILVRTQCVWQWCAPAHNFLMMDVVIPVAMLWILVGIAQSQQFVRDTLVEITKNSNAKLTIAATADELGLIQKENPLHVFMRLITTDLHQETLYQVLDLLVG